MNFIVWKTRKKVCARWSRNGSPTGRIAEPRGVAGAHLTHPPPPHTLKFQFAGPGSGEGRVNRPRSRHCDRLKCRKPGHPPALMRAVLFARKSDAASPRVSRGAFFVVAEDFWPGKIHEHTSLSAPQKCSWRCPRCLLVLCGSFARTKRPNGLFRGPSLSGSHR